MTFEQRFNRAMDRIWSWFGRQVGWAEGRPEVPHEGGFQPSALTGAFVLAAVAYQIVSGGLLLLYYQPSVYPTLTLCGQASGVVSSSPAAWCSTYYIVHSVPMGGVLLTTHLYGAYVVIFLMLVHLFRGYYVGTYKRPGRAFSWVAGVALLLLTLGMGFTGYLLTYTQLSYNATSVSITLVQALPVVGPSLASLMTGDGTPQSLLSRMFALHVILFPGAIAVLVFLHKRTTLYPRVYLTLAKWGLLYVGVLVAVATAWPWQLPTYAGNLGATQPVTVPAWYFLWVFKLVDFIGVTPADAMLFAAAVVLFLCLLPFIDRSHRFRPRDRPVFLFLGNSLLGFFVLMTAWGDLAPGVPITPTEAAVRLGPVVGVNALAVALFYGRYRRSWGQNAIVVPPLAEPAGVRTDSRAVAPVRSGPVTLPTLLSLLALIGSLFLLAFGLLLPFLCLMAAIFVGLAESTRTTGPEGRTGSPGQGTLVFPLVALSAVAALLVALVMAVVA
ncbi:MAG TPA: cytochrome bc complex cytochrome b subunit [Thermoplasmata archaeon]|nr:cytochrome bc complex cytochrome b subunit [Thermoplasmata archaeon]